MIDVGIFYGHLVHSKAVWYLYFVVIWYTSLSFGTFFPPLHQDKSGNPGFLHTFVVEASFAEECDFTRQN
jgi:hypothetical protein